MEKKNWNSGIVLKGKRLHLLIRWLWGCLLCYSVGCSVDLSEPPPTNDTPLVEPGMEAESGLDAVAAPMSTDLSQKSGTRTVWVVMKQKPSLDAAKAAKSWKAKGQAVYDALTATAASTQKPLRTVLDAKHISYKPFWGVNALKVTADDTIIADISSRSDVERVFDDVHLQIPPLVPSKQKPLIDSVDWNLLSIRAPESWADFGTRGEGIVVATIDTGVQYDHPALNAQYRGTQPDGTYDHNYNWFDPSNVCGEPSDIPCDNAGHGTHTMGTIVGDDGDENQIGVAPGARWIAAKGCEDYSCSLEALISSGQWMLAPTDLNGENPRPDLRPQIVSNSWSGGGSDDFYREIVNAWIAAGIFPVFANSNYGYYGCGTSGSPGDYPESYSAGAYDEEGDIADFSSRGPSGYDVIKPNISAPGVDVRSSVPDDDYDWYSGTSMATPHVAGAVALLWAAAPAVFGDIEATRELLDQSAVDREDDSCGGDPADPGNNNVWGEGQLDTYAALSIAPIGPTGYVEGVVTNTAGESIIRAAVEVTGAANRRTFTDETGAYHVRLPIGVYQVAVSSFGYLSQTAADVVVEQDAVTTLSFQLEAAPVFRVEGTLSDSDGNPLSGAAVTILDTPLPAASTDESGYFVFPEVPVGAYTITADAGGCYKVLTTDLSVDSDETLSLSLDVKFDDFGYRCAPTDFEYVPGDSMLGLYGDDDQTSVALPFLFTYYGYAYDTVNITTNGFLSFDSSYPEYYNVPIPNTNPPNAAIYPMWDDLYIEYDSAIYTATVGTEPNRQFVVEWRDAYFLYDSEQQATFEVILNEMGEIKMQWITADTGPMSQGSDATIGIENETGDVGLQYSYNTAAVQSETAVLYEVPFSGFVQGLVTDANDGAPVAGATIIATNEEDKSVSSKTLANGGYRLQLTEGNYVLSISKNNYTEATATLTVIEDETVFQDFVLNTAKGVLTPATLQLVVPQGVVRTNMFTLTNQGTADLSFIIRESGGKRQATAIATAKLARNPNADSYSYTTKGLYADKPPETSIRPSSPGDIISSFTPVGMELAWGIGQVQNLWLSDAYNPRNFEFTVEGDATGLSYPVNWSGYWPADMAYDDARGLVCQLAVGGDNGIYCWDPATGEVVETISGSPWNNISQRGIAYRPSDDTFYVGGWNEGIVYHIAGLSSDEPGEVISSCSPNDGNISGLAYNDAMGVLWIATNSENDTIYEVNPDDCTMLSTLPPPQGGSYQGAGLEMDPEGNLWAIAQYPNTVYLVESGVPSFGDIPWLTVDPPEGLVAPGEETMLTVTVDTTGLEPGLYLGSIFVTTNSGRQPNIRIPVSLVVSAYYQAVNTGGARYVDMAGDTWLKDQAYSAGGWGYVQRGKTRLTRQTISGTEDPVLYQTQRENAYAYRYDDVPNGVYDVDLRFAELERVRIGQRLFDVIIEDTLVLPAHDIQYEVGRNAADAYRFFIEVTDNRMDVRLVPRSGTRAPVINALRVVHRPDR